MNRMYKHVCADCMTRLYENVVSWDFATHTMGVLTQLLYENVVSWDFATHTMGVLTQLPSPPPLLPFSVSFAASSSQLG